MATRLDSAHCGFRSSRPDGSREKGRDRRDSSRELALHWVSKKCPAGTARVLYTAADSELNLDSTALAGPSDSEPRSVYPARPLDAAFKHSRPSNPSIGDYNAFGSRSFIRLECSRFQSLDGIAHCERWWVMEERFIPAQ